MTHTNQAKPIIRRRPRGPQVATLLTVPDLRLDSVKDTIEDERFAAPEPFPVDELDDLEAAANLDTASLDTSSLDTSSLDTSSLDTSSLDDSSLESQDDVRQNAANLETGNLPPVGAIAAGTSHLVGASDNPFPETHDEIVADLEQPVALATEAARNSADEPKTVTVGADTWFGLNPKKDLVTAGTIALTVIACTLVARAMLPQKLPDGFADAQPVSDSATEFASSELTSGDAQPIEVAQMTPGTNLGTDIPAGQNFQRQQNSQGQNFQGQIQAQTLQGDEFREFANQQIQARTAEVNEGLQQLGNAAGQVFAPQRTQQQNLQPQQSQGNSLPLNGPRTTNVQPTTVQPPVAGSSTNPFARPPRAVTAQRSPQGNTFGTTLPTNNGQAGSWIQNDLADVQSQMNGLQRQTNSPQGSATAMNQNQAQQPAPSTGLSVQPLNHAPSAGEFRNQFAQPPANYGQTPQNIADQRGQFGGTNPGY